MKKLLYLMVLIVLGACNGNGTQGQNENDSIDTTLNIKDSIADDSVDFSQIVPVYCTERGSCIYIYESDEDSISRSKYVKNYSVLFDGNERIGIKYKKHQIGKAGKGELIYIPKYESHMPGVLFQLEPHKHKLSGFYYAVTQKFLDSNTIVDVKNTAGQNEKMPADLRTKLEAKYKNKITASRKCASIDGGKANLYTAQFVPGKDSCLAVRVLQDGDKTYIYEDYAKVWPGEGPSWHVDDEGEYVPVHVQIAVRDKNGLKLFFSEFAPESSSFGVIYTKKDKLYNEFYSSYYNYVDYNDDSLPAPKEAFFKIWEKCFNEETPLPESYRKIDLDADDCDEILLKSSSEDGMLFMALFTCKNGVPKLVCSGDIYTSYKIYQDIFYILFSHKNIEIIDAFRLSNSQVVEKATESREYLDSDDEDIHIDYEWKYAKGNAKPVISTKEVAIKLTKHIDDAFDANTQYGWIAFDE